MPLKKINQMQKKKKVTLLNATTTTPKTVTYRNVPARSDAEVAFVQGIQ